jgi:hypothetical protein
MPDRKPNKVYPYCGKTVTGHCAALNQEGWAVFQSEQADQTFLHTGDLDSAAELQNAAGDTRSEISYCRRCPLRVKKGSIFKGK